MPLIKRHRSIFLLWLLSACLILGSLSFTFPGHALGFSFAVMSDPHGASDSWVNSLTEARDLTVNPDPKFSSVEFILVTGDTNPIDLRYSDYKNVFNNSKSSPLFLPVIGNHEFDDAGGMPGRDEGRMGPPPREPPPPGRKPGPPGASGINSTVLQAGVSRRPKPPPGRYPDNGDPSVIETEFISDKLISAIPGVARFSKNSCSYYYDHQNVRIISLDGYSGEIGQLGIINKKGRKWAETAILSVPESIDHIFIAFHAPAFPRVRHIHDSFNADPDLRNAFWNMLVSHRNRVRAVFCGHTHYYSRMRVFDPAGAEANDDTATPDETGGIYQVNVGSTGNGEKNTFLGVEVSGKNILFRAYEAENGKAQSFAVVDEWRIEGNR